MDPFARKMILGSFAFAAVMLLMLAALSVIYFHTHPRCTEQVLSQIPSPDGQWIAAVMRQRCGEESPFFVHVNLRALGSPPRLGFFSGRADDGEVFVAEQDAPETLPEITWISAAQLRIRCSSCRSPHVEQHWGRIVVK
jgi:hypothetical protein